MRRTGLTGNGFLSSKRISTLSYFGVALAIAALLSFQTFLGRIRDAPPLSGISIGWQHDQPAIQRLLDNVTATSTNQTTQADIPSFSSSTNRLSELTEIYIQSCTFPPSLWDVCSPPATPAEEAVRGPWIMLNRDLNKRVGLWYTYVFFRRRIAGSPVPAITNIQLLTPGEAQSDDISESLREGGWRRAEGESLTSGIWREPELNLWYQTNGGAKPITDLQIVYGPSALREGWEEIGTISHVKDKQAVKLQALRGDPAPNPRPSLQFNSNGNFKILQIADLHFSVGEGKCRDIVNETACSTSTEDSDEATLRWLNPLIDETEPDLIVLTGDQLNGQETSWDAVSVLYKVNSLFKGRKIPWTAVYGNHDSETTDLDRRTQMRLMQEFPFFIGSAGSSDVDGGSNYNVPISSPDESSDPLFSLYFLDSHSSHKTSLFSGYTYDWLKDSQISWFKSTSNAIKAILRPYKGPADLSTEDVAFGWDKGLGSSPYSDDRAGTIPAAKDRRDRRRPKRQLVGQELKKPNAMAFFHIPVPEAYSAPDRSLSGEPLSIGTTELEGYSAPDTNSGFFEKALLAQSEVGAVDFLDDFVDAAPLPEVKVLAHGHSHLRDSCQRIKGIWMCFSGGSSYSAYGLRGFDRRVRAFSISDWGETISTYKLLDGSGRGDREDGTFASLSASAVAAQKTGTSKPDQTEPPKETGFVSDEINDDDDVGALDEDTLEEVIEEMAEEAEKAEGAGDWKRQVKSSRYERIDDVILVGKGAMQ